MDCLKTVYADVLRNMMKAVCARHLILDSIYFATEYDYEDGTGYTYEHCFAGGYYCERYLDMMEEFKFDKDDIEEFNDERLDNEKWYDLNKLVDLIEQDNGIVNGTWSD